MAEKTFSPAEAAAAAGIPRATFHSQLARSPAPGPGQGQSRRFGLNEVIRLRAAAQLGRLGVPVAIAAACCASISPSDYADGARTFLALGARAAGLPTVDKLPLKDIGRLMDQSPCVAILDLARIAADTTRILQDPLTRHRADMRTKGGWDGATNEKVFIEVYDPSAQDAPAKPPARKRSLEPA
jgi:hypothetical protein